MAPSSSGPGENFSRARAVCVRVRPADTSPKRQRGGGGSRCWRSGLVSLAPLSTRTEFPVERCLLFTSRAGPFGVYCPLLLAEHGRLSFASTVSHKSSGEHSRGTRRVFVCEPVYFSPPWCSPCPG